MPAATGYPQYTGPAKGSHDCPAVMSGSPSLEAVSGQLCPLCAQAGHTRAVSTIPGRKGVVSVTMECPVCHHKWAREQEDPPPAFADRPDTK